MINFSGTAKLSRFFIINIFLCCACSQPSQKQEQASAYTNQLIHERSTYLLQHAHNPVNWYPWGEEALQKARNENKPIIISIGYSACHWCHVMEKESFSDAAVAKLMNENFVCIKVDREERPDVDQIYTEAAELLTGNAGWPLNAIALPDTRPFFAGTYFTKDEWVKIISEYSRLYQKSPQQLVKQAEDITKGLQITELVANQKTLVADKQTIYKIYTNWQDYFDQKEGGYGRSPKFPLPGSLQTLLNYQYFNKDTSALVHVIRTLDKMATGGIYDHIGGGFARYATDRSWKVPHFEKMLYDNAQLVSVYARAWQLTHKADYKQVVYQTIDFIEREMQAKEGGFYSSIDADSEGEEGKYYVWTKAEIDRILGADAEAFARIYQIKANGNWKKGKNILYKPASLLAKDSHVKYAEHELQAILNSSKQKLLKARDQRQRPVRDQKILTAWNALMLKAYTDAYRAFGDEKFLEKATKTGEFLLRHCVDTDNRLKRMYNPGKPGISGFLDDYAFTIDAFIALYQVTFNEKWLYKAADLLSYTHKHFYDNQSHYFYYTSGLDASLIVRKKELTDGVMPASNSVMAKNLLLLGKYFYKEEYVDMSRTMLMPLMPQIEQNTLRYANWYDLLLLFAQPIYEVAIIGENSKTVSKEMNSRFLPNTLLLGGKDEGSLELLKNKLVPGQTTLYICLDKSCKRPVTQVSQALEQIK